MSYVRGLVPEHPSLERLSYRRPESADSFYSVSSDFEKIAAKQKPRTLPTAPRFGPTGYEKVQPPPPPLPPHAANDTAAFAGSGVSWTWAIHAARLVPACQSPPIVGGGGGGCEQGPLPCPLHLQPQRNTPVVPADRGR